ncbi:hypothetical protein [Ktedonospora formicarum]|uniref:Uncharacterized protein n=1 Tax=Ktedonospora formicarum TaxID=2778364 RepID=A0A8J3HWM9_9CHLR|nr:hypothetical protein [Ktedonospora formicarum]GHO41973.1 hypothetical protein KSX_01360 [Ktedonospora formicarum]
MMHSINTLRVIAASQATTHPIPYYVNLNYADLFKIQHISNPFVLNPVSYSALASYLECPSCSLEQRRKRRPKEPKHYTNVRQQSLFSGGEPDPRLVGTLLHTLINLLHDPQGPLLAEQRSMLLSHPTVLSNFLYNDALAALQETGKLRLAMFFEELSMRESRFSASVIQPLLRYQRELASTGSSILAASERFKCKLLSTSQTFEGHADWGDMLVWWGNLIRYVCVRESMPDKYIECLRSLNLRRGWVCARKRAIPCLVSSRTS